MKKPLILLLAIALISCTGKSTIEEYVSWVQDYENGLHIKKEDESYVYDLQLQPTDYLCLQRHREGLTSTSLEKAREEFQGLEYLTLTISPRDEGFDFLNVGVSDYIQKQQKQYYFSYSFQNDLFLQSEGKELPCVLFHFEKSINSKKATFLLGFEKPDGRSSDIQLIIKSDHLSSLPIRMTVKRNNIPTLAL